MKSFSAVLRIWFLSLLVCAAVVAFSFVTLDVPLAHRLWRVGRHLGLLSTVFGATAILTLEATVVLGLIVSRLTRGHLSRFGEAQIGRASCWETV